jgi:hypothetical protein
MTGWDLVAVIRDRAPTPPTILMTGVDDPSVGMRAHDCQVRPILKPFDVTALKAALVAALPTASL